MTAALSNNNSDISTPVLCPEKACVIPTNNSNCHNNTRSNDPISSSSSTKPAVFITVMTKKHHIIQHHPPGTRPLPSVLTDFLTLTLCDLMPCHKQNQETLTVPGLLGYVQYVTTEARVSCHEAVVALIYTERCKEALPKNAVGDKDTAHRIFVAAVLVACKFLQGTTWCHSAQPPLTNARMARVSSIYSLEQVNQLERSFLNLIKHRCWVDDEVVQEYLSNHRQDLLL